jgi:uncharacterized membrane protein YgdD (TMEM256/DUF423 family)
MHGSGRLWIALAAVSGFVAVAAGAFATHGIADPKAAEVMRTGATYEMFHALAMLACVALAPAAPRVRFAQPLFLAGAVLFSGSLYGLALGAPHWTGIITPFGGVLYLAGWAALAWAALTAKPLA